MLNTDYVGFDISSAGSATWSSCCALCLSTANCRSFTLNIPPRNCYLKTLPTNSGVFSSTHISARY